MSLNTNLLRSSFQVVVPVADKLSARFYERLFQKYPQVQPLFVDSDINEQRRKLVASLVTIVNNLENPGKLTSYLEQLGVRHIDYGAEPGHYDAVGENLLAVLGEFAGDAWSDDVKQAWTDAYGAIAGIMIKAAWPNHTVGSA